MRIATQKDKNLVTKVLHSSFVNITTANSINFVVKQDKNRSKRLLFLAEYMFNIAYSFGEVYISDNENACLLIVYPHNKKNTYKTICWDIQLAIKTIGFNKILKVLRREQQLKKYHINEPHIHPLVLGVSQEMQGKGIGPRLIKEVFEYHKHNTLPCIIETTSESNLKLYKRFGFTIFKKTHEFNYPLYFLRKDF
ncbi:conserved hypothetical protein [Tenacibaculum sediminilitoris]|uniref:GNAT family N-acetyltransferase n=1 Tax=Tenacibaculum sediminilitoris TaxID=1820334 RepID=UPI0038945561